ncbi:IS3 family transposase [Cytophaga hutchinsonii]|uniref:Transposase n=1 Tax=Cytophaga hutchinsonii (strain ATCC 33406 / DSM 1761 / CIP 103989 / NBRC 15051 / NCIMB 9469 / D465) TaxID=269798 RepID=A0A6N4ST56_CYTH3|nr:IS3 family transposase [Cytophaga hutchinsonii]ABG59434.1 transposase [Cytophaga hutchinsonii ATCC 33406]ABG59567.1 transposase [Cytophaga hutchinsonii ATCC 33406]ABG59583.1 transposase [Cytophaga hutchinsonii ATCC 33406]ABG59792.1 transposase [Cytophaga hutchinsonii ATCC 33406]ABG59795.1 transposase [Cytophaga hutchinsonii ATCC 33406]
MEKTGKRVYVKRTQKDYSLAFKLQLVDEVEKGDLTYKQAQLKYGIQGRSTVLTWLRKHGRLDWKESDQMKKKAPNKQIKELERKLKRLEAEKEILNAAIDIADELFDTEIRKKYLPLSEAAFKEKGNKEDLSQ